MIRIQVVKWGTRQIESPPHRIRYHEPEDLVFPGLVWWEDRDRVTIRAELATRYQLTESDVARIVEDMACSMISHAKYKERGITFHAVP